MRTINKTPLFRLHDTGPAVEDIQILLNASDRKGTAHIWSKTDFLEEDGKFGQLTHNKVIEFQKKFGLEVDGIVGPHTCTVLFAPQADRVDQAQGIARNWTFIAAGAVQTLKQWVLALQFGGSPPAGNLDIFITALATHFHINLPRPRAIGRRGGTLNPLDLLFADDQLSFMEQVFGDVGFVLDRASIREGRVFYSMGDKQCKSRDIGTISATNATVPPTSKGVRLICFPPSFAVSTDSSFFRTIHQQASTVLHETCHYVHPRAEGAAFLDDFAYGLPAFNGTPARSSPHNYAELNSVEARRNCESFNLFAEHVTFGSDTRFGRLSDDLKTFECGTAAAET